MLNATARMQRILTANPPTLARIDSILTGEDISPAPVERENRLITFMDAGRRTGLSRPTIYRLVKSGRLDVVPLNGVNRITLASLNAFISGERPADDSTAREIENVRRRRASNMSANRRPMTAKTKGKVNA